MTVQRTLEEILNTIPEPKMEYALLPDGMHLCGLVRVKNTEKKDFKAETKSPAYCFVFRSHENSKAIVNIIVRSSVWKTSTMFKLLQIMSGGQFKEGSSGEEGYRTMLSLIGGWYNLMTVQKPWGNEGRIFVNVVNNMVIPAKNDLGDCRDYFNSFPSGMAESHEDSEPAPATLEEDDIPWDNPVDKANI